MRLFLDRKTGKGEESPKGGEASQALADLASETWRFDQTVQRAVPAMDPMDAERFLNQYGWYMRKVQAVLEESGLRLVDLTGEPYSVGQAVIPLNLEDFPDRPEAKYRIAQMVEPIVMERDRVRKPGSVMLSEDLEEEA